MICDMRWAGHVAFIGVRIDAYMILLGRLDGNRQLGRPSCSW
jgi:hypothetical protein